MSKEGIVRQKSKPSGNYQADSNVDLMNTTIARKGFSGTDIRNVEPEYNSGEGVLKSQSFLSNDLQHKQEVLREAPATLIFVRKPLVSSQLSTPTAVSPKFLGENHSTVFKTISSPIAHFAPPSPISRQSSLLLPGCFDSLGEGSGDVAHHDSTRELFEDSDSEMGQEDYFDASDVVSAKSFEPYARDENVIWPPSEEQASGEEQEGGSEIYASNASPSARRPPVILQQRHTAFSIKSPKAGAVSSPFKNPGIDLDVSARAISTGHEDASSIDSKTSGPLGRGSSFYTGKREKLKSSLKESGRLGKFSDTKNTFRQKSGRVNRDAIAVDGTDRAVEGIQKSKELRESETHVVPFLGRDLTPNMIEKSSKHSTKFLNRHASLTLESPEDLLLSPVLPSETQRGQAMGRKPQPTQPPVRLSVPAKESGTKSLNSLLSPVTPATGSIASDKNPGHPSTYAQSLRYSSPLMDRSGSTASSDRQSTSSSTSQKRAKQKRMKKLMTGGGLGRLALGKSSGYVGPRIGEVWSISDENPGMGSGEASNSSANTNSFSPTSEGILDYGSSVTEVESIQSVSFDNSDREGKMLISAKRSSSKASSGERDALNANNTTIELDEVIQQANAGKCRLSDVLDSMLSVSARIESQTIDSLYKYLSAPSSVEACVDFLRKGLAPKVYTGLQSADTGDVRIESNPYHYVLMQAFTNGQAQLRKSLLSNSRARGDFFAHFEEENSTAKLDKRHAELSIYGMAKILSSLLQESPVEMAEHVGARKGFLVKLVQNHIGVKSVADFVIELCAANALSITESSDELRYGSPNSIGIVLLDREEILRRLVEIFENSTDNALLGGHQAAKKRARQEACLICILEITKRTLVIPKYDKKNCSYGSRRIKQINGGLQQLSAFEQTQHIASMMQFAFGGLFGTPGDRGVSLVATLRTITELLNAVHAGTNSKLASTRIQMDLTPTAALEQVVFSHIAVLSKLMTLEVGQRGSLQQLRLTIIEAMTGLFRSKNADTLRQLARSDMPQILFNLVSTMEWSSMMQSKIIACIRLAFEGGEGEEVEELRQVWMTTMDSGNGIWADIMPSKKQDAKARRGYYGAYVEIGLILRGFAERDGGKGKARLQKLMNSNAAYQGFQNARAEVLDAVARLEGDPIAGPKPEKTTASLLASSASLNALSLDSIDAI